MDESIAAGDSAHVGDAQSTSSCFKSAQVACCAGKAPGPRPGLPSPAAEGQQPPPGVLFPQRQGHPHSTMRGCTEARQLCQSKGSSQQPPPGVQRTQCQGHPYTLLTRCTTSRCARVGHSTFLLEWCFSGAKDILIPRPALASLLVALYKGVCHLLPTSLYCIEGPQQEVKGLCTSCTMPAACLLRQEQAPGSSHAEVLDLGNTAIRLNACVLGATLILAVLSAPRRPQQAPWGPVRAQHYELVKPCGIGSARFRTCAGMLVNAVCTCVRQAAYSTKLDRAKIATHGR